MNEPIAIVGMGCRFAGSPDLTAYWKTVREGRTCFGEVPPGRWNVEAFYDANRRAANRTYSRAFGSIGDIRWFSPETFGLSPSRARQMDPQQRLFLEVTRCALEDAGYGRRTPQPDRTGVFLGISTCEYRDYLSARLRLMQMLDGDFGRVPQEAAMRAEELVSDVPPVQPSALIGQMLNMAAANVAQSFNFRGPAYAVDAACSSASAAVASAMLHLRTGRCDAAIAGGVYLNLTPDNFVGFSRLGALSKSGACKPFDAAADGFVLGEGAGAVVLRRLEDAMRDGDSIWAVLRGVGVSNDGAEGGPLAPSVDGQVAAIEEAYRDAQTPPESVGFVEIHGTGTPVGDRIEAVALRRAMRSTGTDCYLSSAKANVGHALAASGAASLIRAALAVAYRIRPPQAGLTEVSPSVGLVGSRFHATASKTEWPSDEGPRRAGVSAFGFGGTNVHLVLEEAPEVCSRRVYAAPPAPPETAPAEVYVTAPTRGLLASHLRDLERAIADAPEAPLSVLAHTLQRRRPAKVGVRLSASNVAELRERLAAAARACDDGAELASDGLACGPEPRNFSAWLHPLPPSPTVQRLCWALHRKKKAPEESDPSQLLNRIRAIVAETAFRSVDDLRAESRLGQDLGLDSLARVELAEALAREFPWLAAETEPFGSADPTLAELARRVGSLRNGDSQTADELFHGKKVSAVVAANDPRVDSHRIDGTPLLPLAVAIELALSASRIEPESPDAILAVRDYETYRPALIAGERLSVEISCRTLREAASGTFVELASTAPGSVNNAVFARTRIERSRDQFLALTSPAGGRRPQLPLAEFYERFLFHGPALRAVETVVEVGDRHVLGAVRSAADVNPATRFDWLAVDAALQLCAYWARARFDRAALPVGFETLLLVRETPQGARLLCTAKLSHVLGDRFTGDIDLTDEAGNLLIQIRGLRGRLLDSWRSALANADRPSNRVADWPEVVALRERFRAAREHGITDPYFRPQRRGAQATTRIDGDRYVDFSSYDYLGFARDPEVVSAAVKAAERYGTSTSASRLASGEIPLHRELERELADFLGCDDALAMVSGHATNVGVLGSLLGAEDLVVHDALAHDSILAGVRLAGAQRRAFPHNDVEALERILGETSAWARRTLVVAEGAYSMDGDLAPLDRIVGVARKYAALVYVDEAHSLGVVGATGRGVGERFGVQRSEVELWMGTLSKSLGSCGGFVAGSQVAIEHLRYTVPGFVYSVGISPANAGAALAALRKLRREPQRVATLRRNTDRFLELCREQGVSVGTAAGAAIVPCITGDSRVALLLSQALAARGLSVQPIVSPAVEEGKARLRFFVTIEHSEKQLAYAAAALGEELARLRSAKRPMQKEFSAELRQAAE